MALRNTLTHYQAVINDLGVIFCFENFLAKKRNAGFFLFSPKMFSKRKISGTQHFLLFPIYLSFFPP